MAAQPCDGITKQGKTMTKTVSTKMTASEKRGVEKVIRERFKALRGHLEAQRTQIRVQIEEELQTKHQAKLEKYRVEINKLADEALSIEKKGRSLKARMIRDGFELGSGWKSDDPRESPVSVKVESKIRHVQSKKLAEAKADMIVRGQEKRTQTAMLDLYESSILESLWLEDVESEKAKEFLSKIPTIEEMVQGIVNSKPLQLDPVA